MFTCIPSHLPKTRNKIPHNKPKQQQNYSELVTSAGHGWVQLIKNEQHGFSHLLQHSVRKRVRLTLQRMQPVGLWWQQNSK